MADLSITASAVFGNAGNSKAAAVALTAGKAVYQDTNGKYALADAGTAGTAKFSGIALHAADANQPIQVHSGGALTINAVLTAGTFYYLSDTAGGICPIADLNAGDRVIQIGYATSTTVLVVQPIDTGVTLA